jgi:hypothetical protein
LIPRRPRVALTVLAVALSLAGIFATYVKVELAEPDAFADRSIAAVQSPEVRAVIAEEVAVELLERRSPDLVAARPLVLGAVEALLETDSFERILRQSAITAHGVLLDGDQDVTVELAEVRDVLGPALQSASPELARRIPSNLRPQIAEIRSSDAATWTVRLADSASVAALPLLLAALLSLVAVVALAPDRRQAAGSTGLALAAGMAAGVGLLAALRAQVVSDTDAVGVLRQDDVRDAAGAAWDAFAGDLERALLIVGLAGIAVWVGSLLAKSRLDRRRLMRNLADALTGGRLSTPVRFLRGLVLASVGALVLLRADPVFELVTVTLAAGLVLLGLAETLSVAGASRPARQAPPRPRRRRLVVAGVGMVAAAGSLLVLVLRDDSAEPLEPGQITTCNGLAELCDRRLDEVVLPATHNSMSAAARPGWFFANQSRPIPKQLEDGVRWLMVDPHYGIVDRVGRIRTDLAAEGTNRNRVARRLGADAVRAAENLAGRLGLVPSDGKREIFLCHTLCELGAERLGSTLDEIRGWLERNRSEVLVLMLESSVRPAEIERAFEKADLMPYLATLPRDSPLPTLRQMIADGRRLVVLDEGDGGEASWYQPAFVFAQTTSIQAFTETPATCEAGRGTPERPLLMLNHWVDRFPPSPRAAGDVNRSTVLQRRIRECRERLGRAPNVIAVDFYENGDAIDVVRALNRAR